MATTKKAPQIRSIDTTALGFEVPTYEERQWKKVYYGLRELIGVTSKRSTEAKGGDFDWSLFKDNFTQAFGAEEEQRYTLEELVNYAQQHFGKGLEELVEINRKSWERRNAYQQQQNAELEANAALDEARRLVGVNSAINELVSEEVF